ncbi:MAG TPA: replication factor C small subunit [Candidatus Bathyarchaeia archaeon]|nr:replication factor C small subunit [Candidatus Bathyarchaeia archaeon]
MIEEIWIEKYRPRKLSEVVGQDEVVKRLQSYVKIENMPHLMFAGAAGTGKTSAAIALARELYGDVWQSNFTELNASDERGIEVVRNKIKNFARTAPVGAPFKIIFLDEADSLTPDAQSALRRTMESYSLSCRFILSCNYSSKIIEPIQSRCAVYRFKPLGETELAAQMRNIAKKEHLQISSEALSAIGYVAGGDLRRAINTLQSAASITTEIDQETIYQITATPDPQAIEALLSAAINGELELALSMLDALLLQQGFSGSEIVVQINKALLDLDISGRSKVQLINSVGEADFRLSEGADERIQLEALIAQFVLLSQTNATPAA